MSANPFALLDMDDEPQQKKVTKQAAQKKPAQQKAAAPKQDAQPKKAFVPKQPQGTSEKPKLASGQRDRHTKGGRSEGEGAKRPYDRSLNRQTKGQHERKGDNRSNVKGGVGSTDPEADQVAADVDQKKDEEKAKEEAVEEPKVVVPEEPAPFLLADAMKSKQKVAGERTKARGAENVATAQVLKAGVKPSNQVQTVKKGQSKIDTTKKVFNVDEFLAVSGGKSQGYQQQEQYRRRPKAADFPSF